MSARGSAALVIGLVASACTSVATQRAQDRAELATSLEASVGVALAPAATDDALLADQVRALLASDLTEDSAVKIALLNNREVEVKLEELGIRSAELVRAGLLANPVLSANAKFFDGGTEIEASLAQPFVDVFLRSSRRATARSDLEATRASIERALVRLVFDVRRALTRIRAAQRLLASERESLRAARASFDLMAELHRAGNVTDPTLTSEAVTLARAKRSLAHAETDLLEAREPLNILLGLWGDLVAWRVAGEIDGEPLSGFDLDQLESRAVRASLDLRENRALVTAHGRRAGIAGWETLLARSELGLVAKQEVGESEWGLGPALSVDLPLFDTGAAGRDIAHARVRQALARHASLAVEVRSAARTLRERLLAASEEAAFIRDEELPTTTRLVRETLRNYNAMQIGVFDVLLAKQREIELAREYVHTLREAWLARVDLEELLAGSLNRERLAHAPDSTGTSASRPMKTEH